MARADEALHLVQSIYDVTLGRKDWPSVISAISKATNGHSGLIRLVDCRQAAEGFVAAHGYDSCHLEAYRNRFVHLDPYRDKLAAAPVGTLLQSDREAPLDIRRHTEYFNDYERPDDRIHALGSPLGREKDFLLYLGLCRGRSAGPYDDENLNFIRSLLPHILRAVQIHRLIGSSVVARQLSETVLDQLRIGIILMDSVGAVRFANTAALDLATEFRLQVSESGIALSETRFNTRLQRLLAEASAIKLSGNPSAGGDLTYARPGTGILQIRVFPFLSSGEPILLGNTVQIAVFLVRPGPSRLNTEQLARQFGLTAAESRLAMHLTQGETVAEAANTTGISMATARTQLRAIFDKTGTRRQAELALLLLSSLAGLARDTELPELKR